MQKSTKNPDSYRDKANTIPPGVWPGLRLPLCGSTIQSWLVGYSILRRLLEDKVVAESQLPGWEMALLDWSDAVNMYES